MDLKFEVGDKVVVLDGCDSVVAEWIGATGKIVSIDEDDEVIPYEVHLTDPDTGEDVYEYFAEDELDFAGV